MDSKTSEFLWETETERQDYINKYYPNDGGLYGHPYRFTWSRESWELYQEYNNSGTKLGYVEWNMNRQGIYDFQI